MSTGNNPNDAVIVDVLPAVGPSAGGWDPIVGSETQGLTLPPGSPETIIEEARRVLRRCVPPMAAATNQTGLVVGYVQSGKTLSFTTLAALARDNGYRMVIVIAGTSVPLFEQSRQRVITDLHLDRPGSCNPWRHIDQPRVRDNSHIAIQDTLAEWEDDSVPVSERRTVLITVMKHHRRLQYLIDVLSRVDLRRTATIIIDDEGDQAGLNTLVNQGRQSTTYSRLLTLKSCLPHHSYLQYTATPQAPLLINIVDVLSPDFAEVLTPGAAYTGGADFFIRNPALVRQIPAVEVPTQQNPLNAPPPTLLEAMQLFFIGVADGLVGDPITQNRSMLVHPSQRTDPHSQFYNWVCRARDEWLRILELPEADPDRMDLIAQFQQAHQDLAATVPDLPAFADIVNRLRHAIRRTNPREINARPGQTPRINWNEGYPWILVGGQAMDRGFTVEGLTVTYMPRGLGLGNADTIQQRARFFGYKRSYLGHCRIFLGADALQAFSVYIEHEEDIRGELQQFRDSGRPMSEWRRQFFLNRVLRPTRDNVIDIAYRRIRFGNAWVYPESPHESENTVESNRRVFAEFRERYPFGAYDGLDIRGNSRRNLIVRDVPLQAVHEDLLTRYRVTRLEDSQKVAPLLRMIQLHLIDYPDEHCTLFLMAEGQARRRDYQDERIVQLFQGVQYAIQNGQRIETYPGDSRVRADGGISVQLSYLDLGLPGQLIAQNIPHMAVWMPGDIGRDAVDQQQGALP